jgi:glycosyltransferase involved in cell wall biosynthesis
MVSQLNQDPSLSPMSNFEFQLHRGTPAHPAISVICINKNHVTYLEETILSVLSQQFDDFEFIVGDGGSTDGSLELIARHPCIRLVAGADKSREEGLQRALGAARGRYVMVTTSTDGYLSRDWFRCCAEALDADPRLALVYGGSARMSASGSLGLDGWPGPNMKRDTNEAPQLQGQRWLVSGFSDSYLPELNYCVRMDVFRALFGPSTEFSELNDIDPILRFHFEFHRLGYVSRFLPILANFGRTHPNQAQLSERNQGYLRTYQKSWERYRSGLVTGKYSHVLRKGDGNPFLQIVIK